MNILIIGCGKTGSRLARELDERGYDVCVIEQQEEKLDNLGSAFSGIAVSGNPSDLKILSNAGAANMDAAVVVTAKDNVNVMVAQILRLEFDIETIFVRVLDPTREAVFRKFGLQTICPTRFESDALFNLITEDADDIDTLTIGTDSVQFASEKADKRFIGKSIGELDLSFRQKEMPFALKKKTGQLILCNDPDVIIEDGDRIVFATVWGG